MKHPIHALALTLALLPVCFAQANDEASVNVEALAPSQEKPDFESASRDIAQSLEVSLERLDALYSEIALEKVPMNAQLNALEGDLLEARADFQTTTRTLDSRTLDLSNLRAELKSRKDEAQYLKNLLSEYQRNFESRLHIAEKQRFEESLASGRLALENTTLSDEEVFAAMGQVVKLSIDRIDGAMGGERFDGTALDEAGLLKKGTFLLLGPAAFFASKDGAVLGSAEQRLNSAEPAAIGFADPLQEEATARVFQTGRGFLPIDTTLGNAHKIEATEETLIEHIKKGGTVMIPILGMAGLALLVALFKWTAMMFQRVPSAREVRGVLDAVRRGEDELAEQRVAHLRGALGKMLASGIKHMKEPRELVEEVMFEKLLTTRLKLNSYLPFISICAASAPLLGLLGTVTGIISTFKMITVFGSGDVKALSGGISTALITTEFGLIVAIPSLLIHAFLSRKAKSRIDQMEKAAIGLVNEIGRAHPETMTSADIDARLQPESRVAPSPPSASATARLETLLSQLLEEQTQLRSRLAVAESHVVAVKDA